jgi:hypothetical protein
MFSRGKRTTHPIGGAIFSGATRSKGEDEWPWLEIGIVADDESGMAARVCIQHGGRYPLPSVQLGTLIGHDRVFSPHLHPTVTWEEGKGTVTSVDTLGEIPPALQRQVEDLLRPHLVERPEDAVDELLNYWLVETEAGRSVITSMGCLSCS